MTLTTWIARAIATWFGCGYWPWGPGTLGAAAAILIAMLTPVPPYWWAAVGLLTLPISIWASTVEAKTSGRKDPGHVVVDEVAGQWITLAAVPSYGAVPVLLAFALFRLFDITKPAGIRQLERLPAGTGIMADDVLAGIYGAVVIAGIRWLNWI